MDFVIAGASFPCGASELGEVASRHGFSPIFIDHPRNAASMDAGLIPSANRDEFARRCCPPQRAFPSASGKLGVGGKEAAGMR